MFTFFITNKTKQGVSTPEEWLQFTSPEGAVFELQNPKDRIVLSNTKFLVYKLLDSNPQLIAVNGIRKSTIDDLFEQGSRPFSAKWDSIYTIVKIWRKPMRTLPHSIPSPSTTMATLSSTKRWWERFLSMNLIRQSKLLCQGPCG